MRTMNIGKLNRRITFLKLGETEDKMGQTTQGLKEMKPCGLHFIRFVELSFMKFRKYRAGYHISAMYGIWRESTQIVISGITELFMQ